MHRTIHLLRIRLSIEIKCDIQITYLQNVLFRKFDVCVITHLAPKRTFMHFMMSLTLLQLQIRNIPPDLTHITRKVHLILFSGKRDDGHTHRLSLTIVRGVDGKCIVIKNRLAKVYSSITTSALKVNPINIAANAD
jgi:hypothetical protein